MKLVEGVYESLISTAIAEKLQRDFPDSIYHVEKAIELAIKDLSNKYGIIVTENGYIEYDCTEQPAVFGLNKTPANQLITAA